MHALALVVVPPTGDVDAHLESLLARWDEQVHSDGWWDWYQVGGRFTGVFDDGYEPSTDPRNVETCSTCAGTGSRDWSDCENVTPEWIAACNGCNACNGVGMRVKWPTQWVDHPGDVVGAPVALAHAQAHAPEGVCFAIVSGERVVMRERWDGEAGDFVTTPDFDAAVLDILRAVDPAWRVVAVDYHS
jgi:hypothetical protein